MASGMLKSIEYSPSFPLVVPRCQVPKAAPAGALVKPMASSQMTTSAPATPTPPESTTRPCSDNLLEFDSGDDSLAAAKAASSAVTVTARPSRIKCDWIHDGRRLQPGVATRLLDDGHRVPAKSDWGRGFRAP